MFELIGSIFSLAFGVIKMGVGIAWSAVQFVFGLLGGLFSLLLSLGGFLLAGALVLLAIFRRSEWKKAHARQQAHPYADDSDTAAGEENGEEFTSFYDQFRSAE